MPRALYYPHTQVTSEDLLKTSLLLWDKVETIFPVHQRVNRHPLSSKLQEAQELIVEGRLPTASEKNLAQVALRDLLNAGVLHKLDREEQRAVQRPYSGDHGSFNRERYRIYDSKFLSMTWTMLEQEGLARLDQGYLGHFEVSPNLGFLMMSLLADACAGTQLEKITDRVDAYGWLAELRAVQLDSEHITRLSPEQAGSGYERLVSVSFEALGARDVALSEVLAMRKREAAGGNRDYANLRARYHKALKEHLVRIGKEGKSANDLKELERQFVDSIQDDVKTLRSELKATGAKALLSKEMGFAVIAAAGALTEPFAALTVLGSALGGIGVIPLIKSAIEYRAARREILAKHFGSWIYLAKAPRSRGSSGTK